MITKLLHDISQKGYKVTFGGDFSGMITISYIDESLPEPANYIRHEHLGYPDATMDELNQALTKSLEYFLSEIDQNNKPQRDGIAVKLEE